MMLIAADVSVRADERTLLDEVSLHLQAGEVVALVGPNGAGKSTLLKVLGGELAPTGGRICFQGRELSDWSGARLAQRRAFLPQHTPLTFPFRVIEVIRLGRYPHHQGRECCCDREIAERCLERVGLSALRNRRYPTLSGGEKQRVQLARVLAQLEGVEEESLLLLDEPTASLDPAHCFGVLHIARELRGRRRGVVAVLHDLNLAARFADRILVLHQGRLVQVGPPAEVLTPALLREVFRMEAHVGVHPSDGALCVLPSGVSDPSPRAARGAALLAQAALPSGAAPSPFALH